MGSFNVAGGMSHISISEGDEIVFFPLIKNNKSYIELGEARSNLISNEGAAVFLQPFCPPLVGKYADYGEIDVDPNQQVAKDLAEYFESPIEDIALAIARNEYSARSFDHLEETEEGRKKLEELKSLSGMFEFKYVYDEMVAFERSKGNLFNRDYFDSEIMEMMGFKFVGNETEPGGYDRYNQKWINKSGYVMYTDGKFTNGMYYHPCDLSDQTEIDNIEKLKSTTIYMRYIREHKAKLAGVVDDLRAELDEMKKDGVHLDRDDKELLRHLTIMSIKQIEWDFHPSVEKQAAIGSEEELEALLMFNLMMDCTNNIYFPTQNGVQFGEYEISKQLNDTCNVIITKQLRKYDE